MSRILKKKPALERKKKKQEDQEAGNTQQQTTPLRAAEPPSPPKPKSESKISDKTGKIHEAVEFLREVKIELNKVTWPTRKQTTGTTLVVILFVFVIASFLGVFDYSLSKLVQIVLT